MSFQGTLTGSGGAPLEGPHTLVFTLYDAASGGNALWTETQADVPVTTGAFSVILGSLVPLDLAFAAPYWLGITVDGGPELSPRLALASSPYSLALRLPYSATVDDTAPALHLSNPSGPALQADSDVEIGRGAGTGLLRLWQDPAQLGVQILASPLQNNVMIVRPERLCAFMSSGGPAGDAGVMGVSGPDSKEAALDAANGAGGRLRLTKGLSAIVLDSGLSGDDAVRLPASSVGPAEVLGMPGIAQSVFAGRIDAVSVGSMADILTVTLTTTAPGYVTVHASSQVGFYGTTAANAVVYQIDQTAGGAVDGAHGRAVGFDTSPNTNYAYLTAVADRTYWTDPGTHTFRLEAQKTGSGIGYFYAPMLQAVFHPVSYGTVSTIVNQADGTRFERSEFQGGGDNGALGGRGGPAAIVDLRELELRAARAAAESERAQRALLEAGVAAERERLAQGVRAAAVRRARKP